MQKGVEAQSLRQVGREGEEVEERSEVGKSREQRIW